MISCVAIFFFFKQKTAYEMRISDWSSDVCSSDLRRARHQSHVRPRKEGRDAEQRPGSPLAVHAMAKRNLGGLAPAPKDQLAAMAGGVPFHGMNPITPGRASPATDRSEEHTSELQSLMRISYAVFCLKKKTRKHHIIHTHHNLQIK